MGDGGVLVIPAQTQFVSEPPSSAPETAFQHGHTREASSQYGNVREMSSQYGNVREMSSQFGNVRDMSSQFGTMRKTSSQHGKSIPPSNVYKAEANRSHLTEKVSVCLYFTKTSF